MAAAPEHCVVVHARGPRFVDGRTNREQPGWDAHAAFIDALTEEGRVVLAGPFADWSGALLVVRGTPEEVRDLFADDPFVRGGIFTPPDVRPWLIWVDQRSAR